MSLWPTMLLAAVIAPLGATSVAAQDDGAAKIVGAWRYVGTTIDGKPRAGRGANPKGMIVYTAGGNMSVQIAPDIERPRAGAVMTPDEAKIAVSSYIAYFGTYTIDEKAGTVTHHRQMSVQPGDKGDFVRAYQFVGDRLVLRPPNSKQEITWERIK